MLTTLLVLFQIFTAALLQSHLCSESLNVFVNIAKTVIVPLWSVISENNVRRLMWEAYMGWKRIQISNRCNDLGFWIGPGAGEASHVSWQGPSKKFDTRVSQWSCCHIGLPLNALVFNTFVVPVFIFVCQLCAVQVQVESEMLFAMRKSASGP